MARISSDERKNRFAGLWRSEDVQRFVQHAVNKWVFCPDEEGGYYMWHLPTDAPHAFYQVVWGSGSSDGVYVFSVRKRHRLRTWLHGQTLVVCTVGNFDLAEIKHGVGFSAMELGRLRYEQMLVQKRLVLEEDLKKIKSWGKAPPSWIPNIRFIHENETWLGFA